MAIPKAQLEVWSNSGAQKLAQNTYTSIKTALDSHNFPVGVSYKIYLQGSYRSSTNIRSNSDVDVVVELTSVFIYSTKNLSDSQKKIAINSINSATYSLREFEQEVVTALNNYYGYNYVDPHSKAIKIKPDIHGNRVKADVLVCQTHREYLAATSYNSGIIFNYLGSEIVNYPKQHIANGEEKNQYARTKSNYKKTVRTFKNAKKYLEDNHLITKKIAPSYFIESLLFNVPDHCFEGEIDEIYYEVLDWLYSNDISKLYCQNKMVEIFGYEATQWSLSNASQLVSAYISLWNNWGKDKSYAFF